MESLNQWNGYKTPTSDSKSLFIFFGRKMAGSLFVDNIDIILKDTDKFSVFELGNCKPKSIVSSWNISNNGNGIILLGIDCQYTKSKLKKAFTSRHNWKVIDGESNDEWENIINKNNEENKNKVDDGDNISSSTLSTKKMKKLHLLQWVEAGNVNWDIIFNGQCMASNYCVRKGISRKAQFWLTCRKKFTKEKNSILKKALPYTLVVETWLVMFIWFYCYISFFNFPSILFLTLSSQVFLF